MNGAKMLIRSLCAPILTFHDVSGQIDDTPSENDQTTLQG